MKMAPRDMPGWPRLLTDDMAAAYLCVSAGKLRTMPVSPIRLGGSVRWDRIALDNYVDSLGGDAQAASDDELLEGL